jgi:hypothetical protein
MSESEVNGLRDYYELGEDITDEQIRRSLENSLGLAIVRISIAKTNLINAFIKAIKVQD